MAYVIEYVRTEGIVLNGGETAKPGDLLKSYDPDAYEGRGLAVWTGNIHEAQLFRDQAAATRCYMQQSKVKKKRPDGKPNRPLTAATVMIRRVSG